MKVAAFLCITCFSFTLFAGHAMPDSISYFVQDGQRIIIYEVEAGESLYGISQKYGVEVAAIVALNPSIKDKQIREGQIIKIPGAMVSQTEKGKKAKKKSSASKVKLHTIQPGETLYSISRKYNVSVSAILEANRGLQADQLNEGQQITIPVSEEKEKQDKSPSGDEGKSNDDDGQYTFPTKKDEPGDKTFVYHEVEPGETMYSISRQYKVKVTQLLDWNNKEDFNIDVGEELIVGKKNDSTGKSKARKEDRQEQKSEEELPGQPEAGEGFAGDGDEEESRVGDTASSSEINIDPKEPAREAEPVDDDYEPRETLISLEYKEHLSSEEYKEESEKTIAKWMKNVDGYPLKNGYFALHRTLPIGTIIKVTNPVNNRIVFAKVIGHLPSSGENMEVQLKLPVAASKELKAFDEISMLQISYLRERNGQ